MKWLMHKLRKGQRRTNGVYPSITTRQCTCLSFFDKLSHSCSDSQMASHALVVIVEAIRCMAPNCGRSTVFYTKTSLWTSCLITNLPFRTSSVHFRHLSGSNVRQRILQMSILEPSLSPPPNNLPWRFALHRDGPWYQKSLWNSHFLHQSCCRIFPQLGASAWTTIDVALLLILHRRGHFSPWTFD